MESWFVLVQFEKSVEQFKSLIWTVSLANHHAPQGVQRLEKFEVSRACVAPPTQPAVPTSGHDPFRPVHRAVYITKATLDKHGNTANCGKCRAIQKDQAQTTVGHTTDCRKRTEELLGNDMVHQRRVEQANERRWGDC